MGKALYTELFKILFKCTFIGIILGIFVSFGIWQVFRTFLMEDSRLQYQFSILGVVVGLLFSLAISILTLILAMQFMKRTNLIDILNDERRNEPLGQITKSSGISGIVFLVLGLFLGYAVPVIIATVFHFLLPSIWNITYLFAFFGLYRIITYAISYNKRGRKPQKYYKNLISSSMMKFQGKQTARNMLVITLLIASSLFALSYVPMNGFSNLWKNAENPTDFALHYKLSMDEVVKSDIYALADEYQTKITKYNEFIFSELIGSGVNRDFAENGEFIEEYNKEFLFSEFVKESTYNAVMNSSVSVPSGQYILLTQPETIERIWTKYSDLDLVTNFETGESIPLTFNSSLENHSLSRVESQRYILNDEDYDTITKGISPKYQTRQIMFNVADVENSYPFAKSLFELYLKKAPPELARMKNYDAYQHSLATSKGERYGYEDPVDLSWENQELMGNWKYYPTMKIIIEKTFFKEFAVQFLLFIYLAIICLFAVGIITYTRSISVGLSNRQLFTDLKKLGANNKYIAQLITSQLNKIFAIPSILGSLLIFAFMLLISFGNDSQITQTEIKVFGVNFLIALVIWICLFIVYKCSLKKVKNIVGIK